MGMNDDQENHRRPRPSPVAIVGIVALAILALLFVLPMFLGLLYGLLRPLFQ